MNARSLKLPRRLAIVTAGATFLLVLIGGLVHNTRSSLACPDWPLCYGSAFPKMVGGVFFEHSHRLAATTVGVLTIVLLVVLAMRGWKWGLRGAIALGLVIFQGVLGGLTVLFRLPPAVSTAHLATSLFFFGYLLWLAFALRDEDRRAASPELSPLLRQAVTAGAIAIYLQCLLGAAMRHLGAGMACGIDLPLCQGAIWPREHNVYVDLHALHRIVAVVVGLYAIGVGAIVARRGRGWVRAVGVGIGLTVVGQIALGWLSVSTFLDAVPVTAHLGGAALLLALLLCARFGTRAAAVEHASPQRLPAEVGA